MAHLQFANNTVIPSHVLSDLYGHRVNLLVTNPYIMDQILLKPENFSQFVDLSKSLVESQTDKKAHKVGYKAAKDFFDNFEASVSECELISVRLRAERDQKEKLGKRLVEDEYLARCPYTRAVLGQLRYEATSQQPSSTQSSLMDAPVTCWKKTTNGHRLAMRYHYAVARAVVPSTITRAARNARLLIVVTNVSGRIGIDTESFAGSPNKTSPFIHPFRCR